jgi:hypothetical protein
VSYGVLPYGTTSYGGGATTISIRRAWAIATHVVRIELTSPARASDGFDDGDALNPGTWKIERLDTSQVLTPIFVSRANAQGTAFDIRLIEPLGSHLVSHRISTYNLLASNGATITSPYTFEFPGVVRTIDPVSAARRRPLVRDLANPMRYNSTGDTPVTAIMVGTDGDYLAETDVRVVRKGILRRVSTPRGMFRNYPDYGIGFLPKSMVPSGGDLAAINSEIERQVMQEPGVKAVRAGVDVVGGDIARIRIRARMVGAQLEVTVRRAPDGSFVET